MFVSTVHVGFASRFASRLADLYLVTLLCTIWRRNLWFAVKIAVQELALY